MSYWSNESHQWFAICFHLLGSKQIAQAKQAMTKQNKTKSSKAYMQASKTLNKHSCTNHEIVRVHPLVCFHKLTQPHQNNVCSCEHLHSRKLARQHMLSKLGQNPWVTRLIKVNEWETSSQLRLNSISHSSYFQLETESPSFFFMQTKRQSFSIVTLASSN